MLDSWRFLVALAGERPRPAPPSMAAARAAGGGLRAVPYPLRGAVVEEEPTEAPRSPCCAVGKEQRWVPSPSQGHPNCPDSRQTGPKLWLTWPPRSPEAGGGSGGDPSSELGRAGRAKLRNVSVANQPWRFVTQGPLSISNHLVSQNWPIWRVCCQINKINEMRGYGKLWECS